jgi:hypothetical protein
VKNNNVKREMISRDENRHATVQAVLPLKDFQKPRMRVRAAK